MFKPDRLALLCLPLLAAPTLAAELIPPAIEFNRDIRPILSDNCFACHGPDKARRKADLRLDTEAGAFADLGGKKVLVPGKPDQSELFRRISSTDDLERMPPARVAHHLTARQIDLVRRWIEQGAKWQLHWAFIPPKRPPLPRVKNSAWIRNPIDAFVLERLEREGLTPSPEADRTTLIRRLSLDLTGLPPTPAEVDAFLADQAPDAYEKVVDRLLASPRYGERLAIRWLNAARYADSNGYQSDGERIMWRWRDWVIDAFNKNMPFDQFTVEQLAGDLLPPPVSPPSQGGDTGGVEQKIATGFNRNHRGNGEGGIIPEEYAVEYVVDRVETTATVWLGLTLGCTRCHDHKFDPFKQKEFYQLFAYFNNVPEHGRAIKYGNSPPMIKAPTTEQQQQLRQLETRLVRAEKHFADLAGQVATAQEVWEKTLPRSSRLQWYPPDELQAHYSLNGDTTEGARQAPAAFVNGLAGYVSGPTGRAADLDGRRFLDAGNVGDFGFYDKFSLGAWIYPRGTHGGTILSRMLDEEQGDGYALRLVKGRLQVDLVKRWLDDAIHVETEATLPPDRWSHVVLTYDGSRVASGIQLYVDGRPQKVKVLLDELNQSFNTKQPLRIGAGGGPKSRFVGAIAEVRVYSACLSTEAALLLATPDAVSEIAALPGEKRTPAQAAKLRACFLATAAPATIGEAFRQVRELRRQREVLTESFPTCMVMEEMPQPRDTFVLIRGEYDKHGPKVSPGVPAVLSPLPPGAPANRLGLARWLVDPGNPLTARVEVNRFWQMYFGNGLVKTVDDFGAQGDWPSHPELLDFLAAEFVASRWDIKAMQKLIVTSNTYRQTSKVNRDLLHRDPENRLLARGPRFRLPAEAIRDQALAVSGLLVEKVGGPSVKPYQPPGIEKELGADPYKQDHGESLYRRSLYTFWKRTVAPPAMVNFDAPGREMCMVRETRTNTPLQALNLLNDVTFVEAARVLAERVLREQPTADERLILAFRLATARKPRPGELKVLRDNLEYQLVRYRKDQSAAVKLLSVGEKPYDKVRDKAELAAYATVAGLILNLDETITRE